MVKQLSSLVDAEEMSAKVKNRISASRLLELADAGFIPHYVVEDTVLFAITETKEWIDTNYIQRIPGKETPFSINVIKMVEDKSLGKLPEQLKGINHLLIPLNVRSIESDPICGVYFLCLESEIVYIGQSRSIVQRIGQHFGRKDFDHAFLLRVPKSDLNYVEGELIRILKPKLNFTSAGNLFAPSPIMSKYFESSEYVELVKNVSQN